MTGIHGLPVGFRLPCNITYIFGVSHLLLVILLIYYYLLVAVSPGRGLPYGSGLGLSRCLGPGECLHSFNNNKRPLTPKSMPPTGDEHVKLKT